MSLAHEQGCGRDWREAGEGERNTGKRSRRRWARQSSPVAPPAVQPWLSPLPFQPVESSSFCKAQVAGEPRFHPERTEGYKDVIEEPQREYGETRKRI